MNYVFDLDETLCTSENSQYKTAKPLFDRISIVNKLYDSGNTITIYTARGMKTFNQDIQKVYSEYYDLTLLQLNNWNVKFHNLVLGKPPGDIYIDDKGMKDEDFFATNICP